ncbi:protein DBF4 homolog B isoform X2 [Ochotona princeps]|nr:protein DBF4 homolog B isoform X2 [Ochotona princeps]XP_058532282.1 protein DBF4 homolog B isoform X2 [Ochotona princeps]
MAERRLRAADPGAQLGISSCPEKCHKSSPRAGRQPFSGKSFYLDLPAGKTLQFLTDAIQQLGGVIESFLSKEVSYIVSSRREAKAESSGSSLRVCLSPGEVGTEIPPSADARGSHGRPAQVPTDSVPMSRGKELLQKAIRNQGSSSGGGSGSSSSLLSNARFWGVRVLHVDDMMVYVQQLSLGSLSVKKQEPSKPEGTRPAAETRTRKVARLKAPFLKIEDVSRKFRPCHHQFKSFPEISFLGPKDASPFEAPWTPGSLHRPREPQPRDPSLRSTTRTVPRRKKGYCECCQEAFHELHVHLQSAQHRGFALEARPYAEVDKLIAQLSHSLANVPLQAGLSRQSGDPAPDADPVCAKALPHSQPSHPRVAPLETRSDPLQAPGTSQKDDLMSNMPAPAAPVGTYETSEPGASCQEPGGSLEAIMDTPGSPASRNATCQCPWTASAVMDPSSGSDSAPVGHKRKVQFPSGSAGKRPGVCWPQASFFVPRAPSPCGSHFPLLPPGQGFRPSASLLPISNPQSYLSIPDSFPWQPVDSPAESWAAQPPWPGGGRPPESTAPFPMSQQADQHPSCPPVPCQLSTVDPRTPRCPAEAPASSIPQALPASAGASCSRWLWASPPLQVPCLPVPQPGPQPSAGPELLL